QKPLHLLSQSKRHLRDIHPTGLSQTIVFPARNHKTLCEQARHRNPFPFPRTFLIFSVEKAFPLPKAANSNSFNAIAKNQGRF
ncbi:MAG: hypothetical protein NTW86_22195, partial [Candidatus Sumerlaeota bacterium]|nr:hypothetical protein [Candidatus Sumerlaeota bacterium]